MNLLYSITTAFGPFSVFYGIPSAFQTGDAETFLHELEGPAAFVIDDGHEKTRFVSCLIHGNEPSGLRAVAEAFAHNPHSPRANMIYFVGNIRAAKGQNGLAFQHRLIDLPDVGGAYRDMNRIWGEETPRGAQVLVDSLHTLLFQYRLEAAIDLHNTSGKNPPFGVVSPRDGRAKYLAGHFVSQLIELPVGLCISGALGQYCNSFAVECGQFGSVDADNFAKTTLRKFLVSDLNGTIQSLIQFRSAAEVFLAPGLSFDFEGNPFVNDDVSFVEDLEQLNFRLSDQERLLGQSAGGKLPFYLSENQEVSRYFRFDESGAIWLRAGYALGMATKHIENVRNSCLFYILHV